MLFWGKVMRNLELTLSCGFSASFVKNNVMRKSCVDFNVAWSAARHMFWDYATRHHIARDFNCSISLARASLTHHSCPFICQLHCKFQLAALLVSCDSHSQLQWIKQKCAMGEKTEAMWMSKRALLEWHEPAITMPSYGWRWWESREACEVFSLHFFLPAIHLQQHHMKSIKLNIIGINPNQATTINSRLWFH